MYLDPIHFSSLCICHPPLQTASPNKTKFKKKKGKKLKTSLWKLQYDIVSHTVNPFVSVSLLVSVHCRVIGLVLGEREMEWFLSCGQSHG